MAPWSMLVVVMVTWCSLPCCAGIVKVPYEGDGTNDVLYDSAEVMAINKLPLLLDKMNEVGRARKWLQHYNEELENLYNREALADWQYETNITDENAAKMEEVQRSVINWTERQQPEARRFYYHFRRCDHGLAPCKPGNITYALKVIVDTQSTIAPRDPEERDEMLQIGSELQSIYSKAKVEKDGQVYHLEPEITELMATSRDYDELLWAWLAWRNATGRKMRTLYDRFVDLQNAGASKIGLDDTGTHWRQSNYEMDEELETMVDGLFSKVAPLYRQLHAYVRRKLIERYPDRGISPTGPIPAHLLGNMWAQEWNIYDLVVPYPDVAPIDVTANMRAQNYNPLRMFKVAEEFYTSIGLDPMTPTFWQKSMITRPPDREVVCHASAEDFGKGDDYRIKMCTEVNQDDLATIHHEMGHIEYFMMYRPQPAIFRNGANAAFHEAIGDTIALSVMTPGHLQDIELLPRTEPSTTTSPRQEGQLTDKQKREINFLMKTALTKVAFLPFGYLIDKYRWDVFRRKINMENYNAKWWEYRVKYQGISAPVPRSEEDFDPGAKFHVAANVPYIRYFLSFIGQFQFHKALCQTAGVSGNLHECSIYRSKKAGQRLRDALSLGNSRPWKHVMKVLTGQEEFSSSAIEEYFRPLTIWLKKQNRNEVVGWEGEYVSPEQRAHEEREWQPGDSEFQALLRALIEATASDSD